MYKEIIIDNILNNYFYGIDFENYMVTSFKRFVNDKKNIMNAFNESENFDTFILIRCLNIELDIFKSKLSNTNTDEELEMLYDNFIVSSSRVLASFTNDLLRKIGRSIDVDAFSKILEQFDTVGDCLALIYKLCVSEFIDVSKESEHIDENRQVKRNSHVDETEIKRFLLREYKKLVNNNFAPDSSEYIVFLNQYQKMISLINHTSLVEFAEIFKISYSELLKEVEIKNKIINVK